MSRWGRGRAGSVAVPLDSALFRENSNCPSAARSAGTVGKWGITSFTSIRSAPYAFANNVVKKPIQDQNSPLTVPAVETEQAPPKPKKFFKSRNAEPYPPVPQITYAPPVPAAPLSPEHPSNSREKKPTKRSRVYNRDSSSPELPRRNSEKSRSKKTLATKASRKEEVPAPNTQPPNKRYLVRNRDKVINYAEDGSNSPIPDFSHFELPPVKIPSPKIASPQVASPKASPVISSPTPASTKTSIPSPSTSKDSNEERKPPPIVLRISKGTSRIVSTDSNEGFTSPSSDRHSSLDTHSDIGSDHKKSPSVETICSPKHEGLKITIKCAGLNQETKKEKKSKKEHKSHKRHHKNSDDEPLKKATSPAPGSDAYDLYKTLASPAHDKEREPAQLDDIESQLAKLDSAGPVSKSPRLEVQPKELPPEPKPPESSTGRSRRNRPNINYSENDDYLDAITSNYSKQGTKTVSDIKREGRKVKKKLESIETTVVTSQEENEGIEKEADSKKDELINILSGGSDGKTNDSTKVKGKKKHKFSKHSSPDYNSDIQENDLEEKGDEAIEPELPQEDLDTGESTPTLTMDENQMYSQPTQSSDSAYNSCPNENSEEDSQKAHSDDVFKSPHGVSEPEEQTDDKPSVKLVITKKKGSIFKSKSLVNDNPSPLPARKRRHLYRHEWDKGNETPRPEPTENSEVKNPVAPVPEELTRVTRYRAPDPITDTIDSTETVKPYTSVRCAKEAKEFYTVVRNVKKAHQIQEIGEFQELNDDVEYILDALQDNNPMSIRCLSAITLASKCTAPAFRMHLRAHGIVQKFFRALHDATNDQSLGLCTATVMFVLSQDRLNMDVDRDSLELMLNLLESDVSHKNALDDCGLTSAQLAKTQERVRELCAEIKSQGKAQELDLENITVGHLAMETLLSLTSKRAGEWFKEELRVLGGVDHIVRTIQDCAARLQAPAAAWAGADVDVLRKADRCMRVLENVTQQNEDNQLYLINEQLGATRTLSSFLRKLITEASTESRLRNALLDAALPAIKVLVNLSHAFHSTVSKGAQVIGTLPYVMEMCLIVLNNQGNFIPDDKNFEFSVCALHLLINLAQNNEVNTQQLLSLRIRVDNEDDIISRSVSALDLIVDLFYKREELARRAEENADALLEGEKGDKDKKKQSQDELEETVAKLLARAGTHMEHTMTGAYTALLVGAASGAGAAPRAAVRARVPSFAHMLPTLRKYYNFLALTASGEATIMQHVKATKKIIDYMEESDKEAEQGPSQPPAPYSTSSYPGHYYQTSPSDVPQDMSLSNLNYSMNYSSSSSDRMSSSMEVDGYH
ncbi:protein wings apart-like [Amyelois transitella]|uniref:protein wings apart-like n=1 Tax=Amyelois transitella TaxID=680683 RepID=UPI00067AEB97|nr:protein wings apart-like [Amyelois transitella]